MGTGEQQSRGVADLRRDCGRIRGIGLHMSVMHFGPLINYCVLSTEPYSVHNMRIESARVELFIAPLCFIKALHLVLGTYLVTLRRCFHT